MLKVAPANVARKKQNLWSDCMSGYCCTSQYLMWFHKYYISGAYLHDQF